MIFRKGILTNLDDLNLGSIIRKPYDGKEFDTIEYVGEWDGTKSIWITAKMMKTSWLIKGKKQKKVWYASEGDCDEIKYLFDL